MYSLSRGPVSAKASDSQIDRQTDREGGLRVLVPVRSGLWRSCNLARDGKLVGSRFHSRPELLVFAKGEGGGSLKGGVRMGPPSSIFGPST